MKSLLGSTITITAILFMAFAGIIAGIITVVMMLFAWPFLSMFDAYTTNWKHEHP